MGLADHRVPHQLIFLQGLVPEDDPTMKRLRIAIHIFIFQSIPNQNPLALSSGAAKPAEALY